MNFTPEGNNWNEAIPQQNFLTSQGSFKKLLIVISLQIVCKSYMSINKHG
jgi:hypothetical protein